MTISTTPVEQSRQIAKFQRKGITLTVTVSAHVTFDFE